MSYMLNENVLELQLVVYILTTEQIRSINFIPQVGMRQFLLTRNMVLKPLQLLIIKMLTD